MSNYSIVYVSGLYMPASGGAELSIYTALRYIANLGHKIYVITGTTHETVHFDDTKDPNIKVIRKPLSVSVNDFIRDTLKSMSGIKLMITQNLWSDKAILLSKKFGIPVAYIARSPFGKLDVSSKSIHSPDYVFANSPATKQFLITQWGFFEDDILFIPPMVDYPAYKVDKFDDERYVTMINPIKLKGGEIFREIAIQSPDIFFMAVQGWRHLRANKGWDSQKLQDLADSLGTAKWTPQDVKTDDLTNVLFHETTSDMREIYRKTFLLLVPSIATEAAPRVAYEAMSNGIPVIGSNIGGIPWTIGDGGDIIKNIQDISDWCRTIRKYHDPIYYLKKSKAAINQIKKDDMSKSISDLIKIIEQ